MEQNIKSKLTIVETSQQPQYDSEDWKPFIQSAIEREDLRYTLEEIEEGISNHAYQLWSGKESAIITQVLSSEGKNVLNILLCGGSMKELLDELPQLEQFAKFFNCCSIIGGGRKGWIKVLKKHGFKQKFLIEKKVD